MRKLLLISVGILIFIAMKIKYNYGMISKDALDNDIIRVVDVLGGGKNAALLLAETAAAETDYGDAIDLTQNSGFGVFQFDQIAITDTISRTSAARKDLVYSAFGVDINLVNSAALKYSPLKSAIFARLFYLLRPGAIPDTMQERAAYWKKYYNTALGKGTMQHYINAANANHRERIEKAFL